MTRWLVVATNTYAAPPVGTTPANGRAVLRASCGHDVLVSEQGLAAIARGKRLICGPCMTALVAERGARLAIYSIDDAEEPAA